MYKPKLPRHLNEIVADLLYAVSVGEDHIRKPDISSIDREIMRHDIAACKAELDSYMAQYDRRDLSPRMPTAQVIPFPARV